MTTTRRVEVRCSGLPLLRRCAQSANRPTGDITVEPYNDAASLGSAVHEAMERIVAGDSPDIAEIADRWGADESELDRLVSFGAAAWLDVAPHFPSSEAEVFMEARLSAGVKLTGHADRVAFPEPGVCAILDYKSGWALSDFAWQLLGYALLAAHTCEAERFTLVVLHLRHGIARVRHLDISDIARFERELVALLENREDAPYSPGEHCSFCPRMGECPAFRKMIRDTIVTLEATHENTGIDQVNLTNDRAGIGPVIGQTVQNARAIAKLVESFISMVRQDVERNGALPIGDGKSLDFVVQKVDEIVPEKAWPILSNRLNEVELASVVKISKTKVLDAVGARADKGQKGKAKSEMEKELRDAGAFIKHDRKQLRVVNAQEDDQ